MNVVSTQTIDGRKPLKQMNKAELIEILEALELDYKKQMTNAELVKIITSSGKYNTVKESHTPKVYEDGVRVHPRLGKYKRVVVNSRNPKETSLFFSIGIWTYEFRAGEEVELPEKLIRFIKKECYTIEHVYDRNMITENGNVGGHKAQKVPMYFVETVDD